MTKRELNEIAREHLLFGDETISAIRFVHDLLTFKADELKETEPYATVTIKQIENAAYEVWNLEEYIDEVLEDNE